MSADHLALAWLVLAVVLGAAELAIPGVFLAFVAIGAAITGLLLLLFHDLPLSAQLLSFGAWSIAAIVIGRRWYTSYPVGTADPLLNDRAAQLIGRDAVVAEPIVGGSGRVRIGDGEWLAQGPDTPAGTRMRVVRVTGSVIEVAAIP